MISKVLQVKPPSTQMGKQTRNYLFCKSTGTNFQSLRMNNPVPGVQKMNFPYSIYRYLTTGLYYSFSPTYRLYQKVRKKFHPDIDQRLGDYGKLSFQKKHHQPVIWIHAASVGEVNAATGIIEKLLAIVPDCSIIFSTTTKHGQSSAIQLLGKQVHCVYAPLDFVAS
ncbi:MAG: hypothetical protein C0403_04330, partial [Desulfobacterium sp.]|nr:hypothetical protein [Desulfobacterium sp.]